MKWFDVDMNLHDEDVEWINNIGDNINKPKWSIRSYKLDKEELKRISYITEQIKVKPSYVVIMMVPANSICETHVDHKAGMGMRQRITAINIPIQVHQTSAFQYMKGIESPKILEEVYLDRAKCWRVDKPHRVDNSQSPFNRVVLSLSYTESIDQIYNSLSSR